MSKPLEPAPPPAPAAQQKVVFPFTKVVDRLLFGSGVGGVLFSYAQQKEWWDEARTVPLAAMVFILAAIYRGLSLAPWEKISNWFSEQTRLRQVLSAGIPAVLLGGVIYWVLVFGFSRVQEVHQRYVKIARGEIGEGRPEEHRTENVPLRREDADVLEIVSPVDLVTQQNQTLREQARVAQLQLELAQRSQADTARRQAEDASRRDRDALRIAALEAQVAEFLKGQRSPQQGGATAAGALPGQPTSTQAAAIDVPQGQPNISCTRIGRPPFAAESRNQEVGFLNGLPRLTSDYEELIKQVVQGARASDPETKSLETSGTQGLDKWIITVAGAVQGRFGQAAESLARSVAPDRTVLDQYSNVPFAQASIDRISKATALRACLQAIFTTLTTQPTGAAPK